MSETRNGSSPSAGQTSNTEVFALHGAEPEVQAYAMAKYSRSALSMKESLREISSQKAEKFLNTFYFQYGHRSIADLAHIALAVERLSILAAIALVDEQRWDGQERSTRYQDFKRSGYYSSSLAKPWTACLVPTRVSPSACGATSCRRLPSRRK
jgi:thymidylate synthase ThyX